MKKTIIATLLVLVAVPAFAQHPGDKHHDKKHKEITELVSDLSASQKKKIESLSRESKEKVTALRASQKAVRDSIATFMDMDGDQSKSLYPLFDREAALQTAISREMYSTKVKVDAVLTREQRNQLRQASRKENGNHGPHNTRH